MMIELNVGAPKDPLNAWCLDSDDAFTPCSVSINIFWAPAGCLFLHEYPTSWTSLIKRKPSRERFLTHFRASASGEQRFELRISAFETQWERNSCPGSTRGVLTWQRPFSTWPVGCLRSGCNDVIHGANILLRSSAEFFSFKIGSVRDWMGDSKQLFPLFFCLCSLVSFRSTKEKHYYGCGVPAECREWV